MAQTGETVLRVPVAQVMTRNVSTCDVNPKGLSASTH